MKVNYLDLFSGIGGFSEGLRRAGFNYGKHYFAEIDKYAIEIYQKHFPGAEPVGDVSGVKGERFGKIDLITFGFPCQDLSIAGKRKGMEGARSGLFFEATRLIRELKPSIFIFENVKGLFSADEGTAFERCLREIADIGLYECEWQLLNTAWFLPQNRERVYLVGHLRGSSFGKVFPIGEGSQEPSEVQPETGGEQQGLFGQVPQGDGSDGSAEDRRRGEGRPNPNRLTREQIKATQKLSDAHRIRETDVNSVTLKGEGGGQGAKTLQELPQQSSQTTRIRRLTPTEAERLQGFPDGWTEGGLTYVQFRGNISFNNRRYICDKNVELKDATESLCQGKMESVLCTIKGLNGEEQQIRVSHQKENANIVGEMQLQEISALDITNLGNGMVTLCNLKGTYNTAEQIKKNLTQERTEKKSILLLWKICLEESYNRERLSTILTWIKETTKNPIFTYPQTGEPITNVIIHWNWSGQNFIKEESFNLEMANIVSVSDSQRYKCLGNAVTVDVVEAIGKRLLEAANL